MVLMVYHQVCFAGYARFVELYAVAYQFVRQGNEQSSLGSSPILATTLFGASEIESIQQNISITVWLCDGKSLVMPSRSCVSTSCGLDSGRVKFIHRFGLKRGPSGSLKYGSAKKKPAQGRPTKLKSAYSPFRLDCNEIFLLKLKIQLTKVVENVIQVVNTLNHCEYEKKKTVFLLIPEQKSKDVNCMKLSAYIQVVTNIKWWWQTVDSM